MFEQKFTNTNEMLQCPTLHYADFGAANLAQLNTAEVVVRWLWKFAEWRSKIRRK
jgi:hypothetical protein